LDRTFTIRLGIDDYKIDLFDDGILGGESPFCLGDFLDHHVVAFNRVSGIDQQPQRSWDLREYPNVCVNDFLWLFEAECNLFDSVK
jgi:hypothetical protein